MDTEEIRVYLQTALDHLELAKHAYNIGRYDDTVLHCAYAAENASSALLLNADITPSKRHENWYVLQKYYLPTLVERREKIQRVIGFLREIVPHLKERARYPPILEGRRVTPKEYYTKSIADYYLEEAEYVVKLVKELLVKL
jgi:HEPN domain-containing protein